MRTISEQGIALIKKWEAFAAKAYICPAGVLTIGYGSTGSHVKPGMTITEGEAENLLARDLKRFEAAVNRLISYPLSQCQFDALVSFTFNLGAGALQASTLRKVINRGDIEDAPGQFRRWIYAGGRMLKGLIKRRLDEANLFQQEEESNEVSVPTTAAGFPDNLAFSRGV